MTNLILLIADGAEATKEREGAEGAEGREGRCAAEQGAGQQSRPGRDVQGHFHGGRRRCVCGWSRICGTSRSIDRASHRA